MGKKISKDDCAMTRNAMKIDYDVPLQVSSAFERDKLSRKGYAQTAAVILREVPSSAGLVVSVEGAWGSGKTSALALIEALILEDEKSTLPLIVHFNPWLIGDKDALLRNFLSKIAATIKLNDHSRDGKKVAREIKAYAKVFDLVKIIPGAEPWASLVKSVALAAGEATDAISDYKTPDIEAYKLRVEEALRRFDRPIIVFIDDIDRLFPLEVFEMVRIIKSVGGLPRLGYVVAWDSMYVSSALEKLGVPQASSYLDKIVQVRMPLPSLSLIARKNLINDALEALDPEALRQRFSNEEERLGALYYSGLRDLLNQPRDIARVFNAVRMMEPLLREEIVFSDILGLAALSVKAPAVFGLLQKKPSLFVGQMPDNVISFRNSKEIIKDGSEERRIAFEASEIPSAVQRVVYFLFPGVADADSTFSGGKGTFAEGSISHPARLAIALQLSLTDGDVSIKLARQFLQNPDRRKSIVSELTSENCDEFIDLIGKIGESIKGEGVFDLEVLCLEIAKLVELPLFLARSTSDRRALRYRTEDRALQTIGMLVKAVDKKRAIEILGLIATNSFALSCAAEIVTQSYLNHRERSFDDIKLADERKIEIIHSFSSNVLKAASFSELMDKNNAGFILWTMARLAPEKCTSLLSVLKEQDPTLDRFALCFLGGSWDSAKGNSYGLPRDASLHEVYCSLAELKSHAAKRLQDLNLQFPVLAAWRSVVEGKKLYGIDGTEAGI